MHDMMKPFLMSDDGSHSQQGSGPTANPLISNNTKCCCISGIVIILFVSFVFWLATL
jgi:hypothetical protein